MELIISGAETNSSSKNYRTAEPTKGEFGFFFSNPKFAVALTDHISSYPILIAKIDDLDVVYTGDMVLAREIYCGCVENLWIYLK